MSRLVGALHILEETLAAVDHYGERYYEAELYRLKGELSVGEAAEACFIQSIKISKQQGAKSWELRSAMSLARLYRNRGKREESRNLLGEIYSKFTEGFGTEDLREAKTLLYELELRKSRSGRRS